MIIRLCLNEMDLQRSKQLLALLQRQPDYLHDVPAPIVVHSRANMSILGIASCQTAFDWRALESNWRALEGIGIA